MPISVDEIVDELESRLKDKVRLRDSEPALTILWPEFYELCQMERFKEPRPTQIRERAQDKYGLIVAYGEKIVLVAHDRNFAP